MRISVALCTCDGMQFLSEQLADIAHQVRAPDEVVVFDDASRDGTVAAIRDFAATVQFPVTLHVNRARVGVSRNFEQAVKVCEGELIVLADQDDRWRSDKLSGIAAAVTGTPEPTLVISDAELIDATGQPLQESLWQRLELGAAELTQVAGPDPFPIVLDRVARSGGFVPGATMAFTRTVRDLVLPFPDWLPERGKSVLVYDAWIALLASVLGVVASTRETLVSYRIHDSQQVGLTSATPPPIVPRRGSTMARHAGVLKVLDALHERIRSRLEGPRQSLALAAIEDRHAHLSARACLPSSRSRRLGPIGRELTTRRYGRYSSGLRSALRDLVEPPAATGEGEPDTT